MSRLNDLDAWRVFCEIVASGGINAACDKLGVEPSTVSRTLKSLESGLGAPLFSRTTRPAALTELGRRAYAQASPILGAQEKMLADLKGDRDRLAGVIRVATHAGIAPYEIIPGLVEFQTIYPQIQLELYELSNQVPDGFTTPAGEAIDVIVGYGPKRIPPGIVARHCGVMPFVVCASPLYLRRNGTPVCPADLAHHTGILLSGPTRSATRTLKCGAREEALRWRQRMVVHSLLAAQRAVAMGGGIVPDMPLYHCAQMLESGLITQLMPGWHRDPLECYVFAREEACELKRVLVFVDWIADRERRTLEALRARHPVYY